MGWLFIGLRKRDLRRSIPSTAASWLEILSTAHSAGNDAFRQSECRLRGGES
jgi:hypothetical protein